MPLFRHLPFMLLLGGWLIGMLPAHSQVLQEETCVGVPIDFPTRFLAPSGRIERWEWHFGDPESGAANTSSEREPEHTYQKAGTYMAMLVAFSDRDFSDTLYTSVLVHPKPKATFTPKVDCDKGTLTLEPDAKGLSRAYWRLGDGRSDTSLSPQFSYANPGTYTVTLWAETDIPGCRTRGAQTMTWPQIPAQPRVKPVSGCKGDSITLTAVADSRATICWYDNVDSLQMVGKGKSWKTPSLSASATFFATAIHPESGCESKPAKLPVTILTPKSLSLQHRLRNPEEIPAKVAFQLKSSEKGKTFAWTFGDGQTSQEAAPLHTYRKPGTYPVSLEVALEGGCSFLLEDSVKIMRPPKVAIPSAFSPNGDGVNDNFNLELSSLSAFSMQIYDRWGNLIFETQNTRFRWDGTGPTGKLVPEGVYICLIEGRDTEGSPLRQKELLTIIH